MGLLDLPLELISLVLARCDAKTLCRVAASCRLLGLGVPPPPPPRSPVEEALRARAEAGGWWIPASLPEGESSWLSMLAWVETAVERRGRASTSAGAHHSLLLDSRGALLSAGTERPRNHFAHLPASPADGTPGLLGHTQGVVAPGVGAPTLVTPPRAVAALCARPVVAVSAGRHHSLAVTADGAAYSWGNGREGLLGHGDEVSGRWGRCGEMRGDVCLATGTRCRHFPDTS
jgi:regulator of chromosome condensation